MALRQSDRLRRRSSQEYVPDANGVLHQKVKTTVVIQGDVTGTPVVRHKGDIELLMECEEDALTPVQLRANHQAKEAHALAMRQIRAAQEGRLSFVRGTPVIHDKPIIVQQPQPPVQNARANSILHPSSTQQVHSRMPLTNQMARPNPGLTSPPQQMPSKHRQTGSIPVGRVAAQPRKQVLVNPGGEVISGTFGLGVKRVFPSGESPQESEAAFKKQKKIPQRNQMDSQGTTNNWVSLDDYYYGKVEGDAWYIEETGEYRFKCWYCNKMLYNNIKAMMHLQSHIDSEKQHNLDLSDLTQCKHCYKQFDTPFDMQTHIERVHLSNSNVLMCRICEKDHETNNALSSHMKQNHGSCEMPYICQLCNFRSSMYSDVVDHFKKKHDSSPNLLCLYCLKVYKVKFVLNGWGITQNYYHHLVKHQGKSRSKKCTSCKLSFFTPQEMKMHKKKDHAPNSRTMCMSLNSKGSSQDPVMIKLPQGNAQGGVKSLNAPAVMKNLDLSRVRIPGYVENFHCFECKGSMSNMDHFKKYTECSMCRYATSCSSAYANHMMSFHSGRSMGTFVTIPKERPLVTRRHCLCGFSSRYGNKIANHMVFCYKRTCYNKKPEPYKEVEFDEREMDPRRRPGASILDALGLVKKQTAKRSADLQAASTEALLSQFEKETFVGVTNLSIAQVLSDNNKGEEGSDVSEEFDVEEEVESDDDDDDYKPGRFTMPPNTQKPAKSRRPMLVKLNFMKGGKAKKMKSESDLPLEAPSGETTATEMKTSPGEDDAKPIIQSISTDNQSASNDSKISSQSDAPDKIQCDQSEKRSLEVDITEDKSNSSVEDSVSKRTEDVNMDNSDESSSKVEIVEDENKDKTLLKEGDDSRHWKKTEGSPDEVMEVENGDSSQAPESARRSDSPPESFDAIQQACEDDVSNSARSVPDVEADTESESRLEDVSIDVKEAGTEGKEMLSSEEKAANEETIGGEDLVEEEKKEEDQKASSSDEKEIAEADEKEIAEPDEKEMGEAKGISETSEKEMAEEEEGEMAEPDGEKMAEPEAEEMAEPEAEEMAESETEEMAEPDGEKMAEPEAEEMAEPQAEEIAEPEEMAEPEAEEMAEPEAEEIAEPKAEEMAAPEAEEMAEPKAEEMAEPEAEEMAAPEAEEMAEPKAEEMAAPEAEEIAEPKAEEMAEPDEEKMVEPEADEIGDSDKEETAEPKEIEDLESAGTPEAEENAQEKAEPEETGVRAEEQDPGANSNDEDMAAEQVSPETAMATHEAGELSKADNSGVNPSPGPSQEIPEEADVPKNSELESPEPSGATLTPKLQPQEPRKDNSDSSRDDPPTPSAEKKYSGEDNSRRDSFDSSHSRSSSSEHRHHSRSSHDKSDRRHNSSGSSYHRDRSYDGYHGSRHDRDDKYRDRSSGRYDDRGHSSRDYGRYDDRGHGNRDYGGHGNRDRYHDSRKYDDRHHDRGHRKDGQGHGNWQGRGGSGYYGNQRRDYY